MSWNEVIWLSRGSNSKGRIGTTVILHLSDFTISFSEFIVEVWLTPEQLVEYVPNQYLWWLLECLKTDQIRETETEDRFNVFSYKFVQVSVLNNIIWAVSSGMMPHNTSYYHLLFLWLLSFWKYLCSRRIHCVHLTTQKTITNKMNAHWQLRKKLRYESAYINRLFTHYIKSVGHSPIIAVNHIP